MKYLLWTCFMMAFAVNLGQGGEGGGGGGFPEPCEKCHSIPYKLQELQAIPNLVNLNINNPCDDYYMCNGTCIGGERVCTVTEDCQTKPIGSITYTPIGDTKAVTKKLFADPVKCYCDDPCHCHGCGDVHYYTYDLQGIHFQGICKYLLTGHLTVDALPQFQVYVKNEYRWGGTSVSWTQYVELVYDGHTVRLGKGPVISVPAIVSPPWTTTTGSGGFITVTLYGGFSYMLETDFGLKLQYIWNNVVKVELPGKFRDKVTGICGDCNGNKPDDLNDANGNPTTGTWYQRYKAVGDSYQVYDPQDPQCAPTSGPSGRRKRAAAPCAEYCSLLDAPSPLEECLNHLGADAIDYYRESCLFDAEAMCDDPDEARKAACDVLEEMIANCADAGVDVDLSWRDEAECPLECPEGLEYTESMSPCGPTCAGPAGKGCTGEIEGCTCPAGQLMSGNECVDPEECGCLLEDGTYLKIGETLRNGCAGITCVGNGDVENLPLILCPRGQICVVDDDGQPACMMNPYQ